MTETTPWPSREAYVREMARIQHGFKQLAAQYLTIPRHHPRHYAGQVQWERIQALPLWAQPPLLGPTARDVYRSAHAYDTRTPKHRTAP